MGESDETGGAHRRKGGGWGGAPLQLQEKYRKKEKHLNGKSGGKWCKAEASGLMSLNPLQMQRGKSIKRLEGGRKSKGVVPALYQRRLISSELISGTAERWKLEKERERARGDTVTSSSALKGHEEPSTYRPP